MFKVSRVCAAVAGLLAGSAANAVVVDLFDVTQPAQTVSVAAPGPNWDQTALSPTTSIFGGYRDIGIGFVTGHGSTSLNGQATISVESGVGPGAGHNYLSISNAAGVSATSVVRWDGAAIGGGAIDNVFANPPPYPPGANPGAASTSSIDETGIGSFLGTAADSFEVLVISSDLGFEFTFELYTDVNRWSSITFTANAHAENFPGTPTYISLGAFLDCANAFPGPQTTCGPGGAADLSNIGALQLIVNPYGSRADFDLRLNQISTVPEPGSLALTGLALLGVAGARAKRRKMS